MQESRTLEFGQLRERYPRRYSFDQAMCKTPIEPMLIRRGKYFDQHGNFPKKGTGLIWICSLLAMLGGLTVVVRGAPPINDNFASSTVVSGYKWQVDSATLAEASRQRTEPNHGAASVWWSWIAPGSGDGGISVFAPNGVTVNLAVYLGASLSELTPVTLSAPGFPPGRFNFTAVGGQKYYLAVATSVEQANLATNIGLAGFINSVELGEPIAAKFTERDEVPMAIRTTEKASDIAIVEYYANDQVVATATAFPYSAGWSHPVAGLYQISARVRKVSGPDPLTNSIRNISVAPGNDNFADRMVIRTNVILLPAKMNGSLEVNEPDHGEYIGSSTWYSYTAPEAGRILMTATEVNLSAKVQMYRGSSVGELKLVQGIDSTSQLNANVQAGETYQIAVCSGNLGYSGKSSLWFKFLTAPANDNFANSIHIEGADVKVEGHTFFSTLEAGESSPFPNSIWWSWRAAESGILTISNPTNTSWIGGAVYTGNSLTDLKVVHGMSALGSSDFNVSAGTTYHIQIGSYWGELDYLALQFKFREGEFLTPPVIQTFQFLPNNSIFFAVSGKAGDSFRIDASPDLVNWTTVYQDVFSFQYPSLPVEIPQTADRSRFFRLIPL
jgi:hypothetical protein